MTRQEARHAARILTAYADGLPLQMKVKDQYIDLFKRYSVFELNPTYAEFRIVEDRWIEGDTPGEDGMYYVSRYNVMYRSTAFLSRCRYENGKWKTWAKDSKIVAYMPYTELFKPKPILIK